MASTVEWFVEADATATVRVADGEGENVGMFYITLHNPGSGVDLLISGTQFGTGNVFRSLLSHALLSERVA